MKLHLPVSLFKCLMSLLPVVTAVAGMPVSAEVMHQDITLLTYTDFGQNTGRYVTNASANSLLQYIRQQEGGVVITYTGGQADYKLAHGMIDFGSAYHVATAAAISPAAIATAAHHDINFTSTFTNKVYGIGNENAIKYKAIEYVKSSAFSHQETEGGGLLTDHKVVRLSKIITDVSPATIYNVAADGLNNLTYYHVGSGRQWIAPYTNNLGTMNNSSEQLISGYNYVTGGISTTDWVHLDGGSDHKVLISEVSFNPDGINASNPLTWVSKPGDSGSPLYVWDESKHCYSYVGSNYGEVTSGPIGSVFVLDPTFDQQKVDSFTKVVNMGSAVSTIYLNAVNTKTGEMSDGTRTGEVWSGTVTDGANTLVSYNGLKSGLNTWGDLNGVKDNRNWYSYDENYVIQSTETLFPTENLQFNAQAARNTIILNDSVDLGIGYAEFNAGTYTITSAEGEANLFNHAGYVVNAGAEVHVQLTNPADYMREWRKIGAGNLYIEGSGNNHILLNVGGGVGKTYLNRTGGYAAYNVLVNNGATVVISNADQIKRDLTFGNRGGTLELNGTSMDWYTTAEAADATRTGFSINALTDDAIIANTTAGTASALTYKEDGETSFLGSFVDSADSSLKVVYDADGTWVLNSVRTNLQHADSGLQVNQGTVVLRGTNTVHGTGSDTGRNENRYFSEDDWHYADSSMNVAVQNGGTFELGSHARLTGEVTVNQGGTFVMREAVRHRMEYVEGGQKLEDTGKYSAYFGHKGDVHLNGGTFAVEFNSGVDSQLQYAGSVTGTGTMTVDTGSQGGSLAFSGTVDAGVSKTLNRGQLILTGTAAADTTNKWLVNADGVMVQLENAQDTLSVIDASSTGTLGLTRNCTTQLDFSSHAGLHLGAQTGKTVQYGEAGTTERLTTLNFGGGGKLVVNYALSGTDTLNVNAGGMSGGEIQLANVAQNYNGTVNVQNSTLTTASDGALNGATVNLNAGGTWQLADNQHSVGGTVNVNTGGTLQGKDVVLTGTAHLAGSLDYDSFTVQNGGNLVMQNGGAFDTEQAVVIANGGTLDLNGTSFTQKTTLTDGGRVNGQGATVAANAAIIATSGTGVLSAGSGTLAINGLIGAETGAKLRLEGSQANIYTGAINTNGGTLELACSTVNLGYLVNNGTQTIGGTLSIAGNVTINANQTDPSKYQIITHNINHLDVTTGSKLTLVDPGNSWNHIYNISSLTGTGEIHWKSNIHSYPAGPSRMILLGDNSFSGTLIVEQQNNDGSMQHVSLANDNAAKNMVINLWGDDNSRPGLAISTANAHVAGIGGTTNTFVYAGAVKTAGNGNNPISSALNTLTIDTKGKEHTYNGTILGDSTYGLNIVKDGTGTQTFTNSANVVHDVTALQGSLEFTSVPVIYGDVSIAQGAEMTLGSGAFSLNAGHSLNVLAGSNGGTAVLNNSLVLNGGELYFAAYGTDASLQTGGVSVGAGVSSVAISFDRLSAIEEGVRYQLASGDWSSVSNKLSVSDISYLDYTVHADNTGLYAAFELKDNYAYWQGSSSVLNENARIVFTGQNGQNAINLDSNVRINLGIFNHDGDFSVVSANGSTLSLDTLEKSGAGVLHIDATVATSELHILKDASFAGEGQLSAGSVNIAEGLQATFRDVTLLLEGAHDGGGTLRMEEGSVLKMYSDAGGKVHLADGSKFINLGYPDNGVFPVIPDSASVTLGDTGKISRVMQDISFYSNIVGKVNVLGDTTLAVEGSGTIQYKSYMDDLSALELQKNVTMSLTSAFGTHLVLNGGSASAQGGQILRGDITVMNEGVFTFTGDTSVCDTLAYSADYKNNITVTSGGELAFGNTRQTMGFWTLTLSDGAKVTGTGGSYTVSNAAKSASMDFNENNSTIRAISGSSTISAVTRLRGGNNLNYDVSEGATLTVSGLIHADGVAGKGSITKNGAGILELTSANTYANTTTINGGTLRTSVVGALGSSSVIINDGGTLQVGGDDNKLLGENITINAGGTLSFIGAGSDIINYNQSQKTLTVSGGTIDFGSTRQTMGSWSLNLSDGAIITGVGNATYGAMDFNNNNSTITATSGENTISAVTRLRNGNNLNYDVSEGATLTVSGLIHADSAAGKGSITKNGAGILVLTSANTYANTTTINGGTLKTSVVGALGSSSIVINKGATLELMPAIAGITYENGKLSGSGCLSVALTSDDNTINLGSSFTGETYVRSGRLQTSGATVGSVLRLADGAELKANGDLAADVILEGRTLVSPGSVATNFNGTVTGKGTFVHISNQYYHFNKDVKLAGFVQEDRNMWGRNWFNANAEIETVSLDGGHLYFNKDSSLGSVVVKQSGQESYVKFSADANHSIGSLTQTAGKINFNGSAEVTGRLNATGGNIELQSGELRLTYAGDDGNRINLLDGSISNSAAGTLSLEKDVKLTIAGDIWLNTKSSISMESGSTLTTTQNGVILSNRQTENTASISYIGSAESEYSEENSDIELTNLHVQYDSSRNATLGNKLTNCSVENINKGGNLLTISNENNDITALYATGGSIDLEKLNADVSLELTELTVANSRTVGIYSGSGDTRTESNVTVTSHASFGTGAVLNANLTLATGSTLSLAEGGLAMGSTLTLQKGIMLDNATLERIHTLELGESLALFTGVDGLTLGDTAFTSLTEQDSILASTYFSNLYSEDYLLTYSGINNGTLALLAVNIPEPTTATLSILALAGLAMRRRRK